jgi:excisionase family DNA binding protein
MTLDNLEFGTIEELAARLKVKRDWFYQRIHAGNLPFPYVRVGGHLRFPLAGVQRWLDDELAKYGKRRAEKEKA